MNTKKHDQKEPYFIIYDSFVTELNLSALSLQVFSLIYSFCENGKGYYNGTPKYLAQRLNATKRGVQKVLNKLVDKGLLSRELPRRIGIGSATYRLSELVVGMNTFHRRNELSDRTKELCSLNNKDIENKEIMNVLDLSKSQLLEIRELSLRRKSVYIFAGLYLDERIDNYPAKYIMITQLISEMISQPKAIYNRKTVYADNIWNLFVLNLEMDESGCFSINHFICSLIDYTDMMESKNVKNLVEYTKAIIWSRLERNVLQ